MMATKKRKMDFTCPDISALTLERNKLMVSKSDPKRLEQIKKRLDFIDWGIK